MYSLVLTVLFFFSFSMAIAQNDILNEYRWENRLLILYSANSEDELVEIQKMHFHSDRAAYEERDLIVFHLTDDSLTNLTLKEIKKDIAVNSLKQHLSVNGRDTFRVFLIGKDGGIKIDSDKPLSNNSIFGTIDAMPMRRNEMSKDK